MSLHARVHARANLFYASRQYRGAESNETWEVIHFYLSFMFMIYRCICTPLLRVLRVSATLKSPMGKKDLGSDRTARLPIELSARLPDWLSLCHPCPFFPINHKTQLKKNM